MWPSEELASRLYDLANMGLIAGLVAGVVSTVLIVWMGNVKEGYLKRDVAHAQLSAAEANEKAEAEKLARVRLEKDVSPRRLTGEQRIKLTKLLEQYADPVGIVVVSAFLDSESSDFADDFNAAIADAKWKTLRFKDRLTQRTGISLGVLEGTPRLDPWGRPIIELKQRVGEALTGIGILYNDATFGKDDIHSTGVEFERGPIYLVVEHKPPIKITEQQK